MRRSVIHESVLYDALGETTNSKQKDAKKFLNDLVPISYSKSIAFFPGQVFDRLGGLAEKCPELIAFLGLLSIKYPMLNEKTAGFNHTYHPYVGLACDLGIQDGVCIVSTNEKFEKKLREDHFLFFLTSPLQALIFLGIIEQS